MKMMTFFLFINIFSISYREIEAYFFCDDEIQDIYVIKGSNKEKIADKMAKNYWKKYYYSNLDATPGDLIRFGCYNSGGGITFGGACFYLFEQCNCYNFNNIGDLPYDKSSPQDDKAVSFWSKKDNKYKYCYFSNLYPLKERNNQIIYYYQNYVPLDAREVQCQSYILPVPKDEISNVKISDFITADFDTKNVEVTIIENNDYFTLNGNILKKETKFKVTDNLYFISNETKIIQFKFIIYGKIIPETNTCVSYIRVCYERCQNCNANIEPSENEQNCLKCKNGYYLFENTFNCLTKNEIYEKGYYISEKENIIKKCYADCKTCLTGGDSNDMNCDTCAGEKKYFSEPHNCISDITHYYYSEENNIYKRCYERCYSCYSKSTANEHNCNKCETQYHFIYNETGKCINETEKPSNTYLDNITNTYRLCYERCSTCDKDGDIYNNNCKDCARNQTTNNYIYHFIYNETGKCINESEKPSKTCLDNTTNTFILCYESESESDDFTITPIILVIILSIILIGGLGIMIILCYRKKQIKNRKDNTDKYFQLEPISEDKE